MILVDIYVPSVNETYDFLLDESARVREITGTVTGLLQRRICGKEQPPAKPFLLCDSTFSCVLPPDRTLTECAVRDGSRLFIV